jgi:lipoyl(octanoyl) transferase
MSVVELRVLPGITPYEEALALQTRLVERRRKGEIGDVLLLLEHPPVLTLGRHADEKGILASRELLGRRGIGVHRVERGGQATYHGPGQIVGYPILHLAERRMGVGRYVRALEEVMIRAAEALGVPTVRREGIVGVFAESGKVGAIGVRVSRGVSYHGFAFNVDPDLEHYRFIVPCGMAEIPPASIASIRGAAPDPEAARREVVRAFEAVFAVEVRPAG